MYKQKGFSAVILLLSLLLIVAIGFTGYYVWNTQNNNKEGKAEVASVSKTQESSTNSASTTNKASGKIYDTPLYSFEYPAVGWNVEQSNQSSDPNLVSVVLKTQEYEATMGPNVGAIVSIFQNKSNGSLDEEKQQRQLPDFGATNFKDLTIGGVDGFSYETSYEGKRYRTVAINNDKSFEIIYMHEPNANYSKYSEAYEMVVGTFKFK